jgi:SAM-dependent methyltransferase
MANKGWAGLGVEPNQGLVKYAQESLGIHSICSSFESFAAERQFDAVSMIQVISHVVNTRQAIVKAAQLLLPGGLLLIETWDRRSWTARLLGRRWHEYSPPSVLHWFTRTRLEGLLSECGLEVIESGRPRRWIQMGHAKSLVRHKYGHLASTALAWLPAKLQVPYIGDDLIYVLVRKR